MIKRISILAVILLFPVLASAQQQQITPSEAAIQIDSMVNQVAQMATNQIRAIESLQKQVQDQQKEIADLHKKLDASKASSASPPLPIPAPKL